MQTPFRMKRSLDRQLLFGPERKTICTGEPPHEERVSPDGSDPNQTGEHRVRVELFRMVHRYQLQISDTDTTPTEPSGLIDSQEQ